jgi:hypothetical protein
MLTYSEMASEVMWHLVTDDEHGYSQPRRMGDGTTETIYLSDGTPVCVHGGDYDCSEAVRMCYAAVGVLPDDSYMWTGNERELLLSNGFEEISPWDAQDGDVVLTSGHTEMVLDMDGSRIQAGFRHSEDYDIDGETGDQNGDEATWSGYRPEAWETAFRCCVERTPENVTVIDNREVVDMTDWAIVAFDGCGYLYAAGKLHPLANSEEQMFVEFVYGEAKKQIDSGGMPHIVLGDGVDAPYGIGPWGKRLQEILAR